MSATAPLMPTIGIDVGGTFTDFVAVMPDGGQFFHKEPSTPASPSEAVGAGLAALVRRHPQIAGGTVRIVHGTTLALNAILTQRVADVALIVSEGHRDVLEIGRAKLRTPYNLHITKEQAVVPRRRIFEVPARLSASGAALTRPDEEVLDVLAARIATSGAEAVAVMLLNSYVSPSLEAEIAEALRHRLPDIPVTCSAEIWPEIREFERAVVACINAQVHPLMADYLRQLQSQVGAAVSAILQLTSSSGGMLGVASAVERPVETVLSGPASGASAAARLCQAAGIGAAITFDMGGTSADIAVISEGEVAFTTGARVGDLPLMMPVVGVSSIGAGGGSIVSVDAYGVIKVGPQSAGARPGPVAYGLGGTQPTVTDCYIVLGLIDPAHFLGGAMCLDAGRAEDALAAVASHLGLPTAAHAAAAALRVATVRMASELFKQLAQKGLEPAAHVLIPFGGAGPTHAVLLAEEAKLAGITVPTAAATFCALGAAMADLRRDFVRSLGRTRLHALAGRIWPNWSTLEKQAHAWIDGEGVPVTGRRLIYAVDMQYAGQSYSLTVPIPAAVRDAQDLSGVMHAFHQVHECIYGFREPDHAVEAVTQRLSVIGEVPKAELPRLNAGSSDPPALARRRVFHDGAWIEAVIFRRETLGAGARVAGPAVIEQDDTTLWMPPGWSMTVDPLGLLVVARTNTHAA